MTTDLCEFLPSWMYEFLMKSQWLRKARICCLQSEIESYKGIRNTLGGDVLTLHGSFSNDEFRSMYPDEYTDILITINGCSKKIFEAEKEIEWLRNL